ncbi:MAG: hypothetical protein IKS04_00400, partial [Clostridia bacterium]|nr:hypothetical protein [Clostridia bacterium]
TALVMALLIAATMPAQVFAGSIPEYISEVKIGMGKKAADAKAALNGYKILSDAKGNPIDLNNDAGGGWGSKGEKVVYLGYKTTADRKEAVTDLALMNMKGGYSTKDYDTLMEGQLKSQIIPFVENFQKAINEYRANYRTGNSAAKQRCRYIHDILNKFIDDDTGRGLGDLLLNETNYELGVKAYNKLSAADKAKTDLLKESRKAYDALSDAEKKEHADILTILAQSNGQATLIIENLITRAADHSGNTWIERMSDLASYEDFADMMTEEMDMLPSEAEAELAKLYEDDAKKLLNMWDAFRGELENYDEYKEYADNYDAKKLDKADEQMENVMNIGDKATEEEINEAFDGYVEAIDTAAQLTKRLKMMFIHDFLEDWEYEDGTMLDFFLTDTEEIREDIRLLYPVVASLSDGQRAGMEFISLDELVMIAAAEPEAYSDPVLEELDEVSIYENVNREIYQKGGVGLTSDALRDDVIEEASREGGGLSGLTIASIVITGVTAFAAIASGIGIKVYSTLYSRARNAFINNTADAGRYMRSQIRYVNGEYTVETRFLDATYASRTSMCKYLTVGFSIAVVILAGITTYLTYRDMVNHYKVEFTPIPRYMVDEKDIVVYNESGEKTVIKNQAAYYKAVECNRTENDEFYKNLGTCADMNGDVGQQWLALYAQKSDVEAPILANSLLVVIKDKNIPAGYTTGIHMFGSSDTAFNLNNELYDWNKSAPSIMVYFKTDKAAAKLSSAGSNFTAGTIALAGVGGLAVGAVITALAAKTNCRKKKNAA